MKTRRWYQEIIERRGPHAHTGWRKSDSAPTRRRKILVYQQRHHRNTAEAVLASARWARALANVHQDPATRRKLTADAAFFFRGYHRLKAVSER